MLHSHPITIPPITDRPSQLQHKNSPQPNKQLLQSYWLTNNVETSHLPQCSIHKLHIAFAGRLSTEGGTEERTSDWL